MKPKSKLERDMLALAQKLPPITEKQRQYAYDHCFTPRAVYKIRKGEVRCLCCGQTAVYPKAYIEACIDVEEYDCPYCGKSTGIEQLTKETKTRETKFFTILTTFRGFQVARTFEVSRCNYTADHFARYSCDEIFQIWLTPEGKEVITGRQCHRSAFSLTWDFHKPYDIRQHNASCTGAYAMEDVYDISGNVLYPQVRVTPVIRRNGWTKRLLRYQNMIAMTDAMRWLLIAPTAEMLAKTGQLDLFLYMVRHSNREMPFMHSIRIANRNRYIVKDAQMWLDMLNMAADIGLDTHNPKVVCPDNLVAAHDAILRRYTRKQEKQRKLKQIEEAKLWEAKYRETKGKFFGICFGNENIIITVVQSVADIAEEGKAMHHCVYAAGYYKKEHSLILSAKDAQGNRLETIEVNLRNFTVAQSRAKFNKTSPRHEEILQLLKQNMPLIRKAAEAA